MYIFLLFAIRSTYDMFEVHDNKGVYRLKGKEGWWNIQADNTFTTNGANPQVSTISMHISNKYVAIVLET